MKISVFTVCMPEYTPAEGAKLLAELGYDGVYSGMQTVKTLIFTACSGCYP